MCIIDVVLHCLSIAQVNWGTLSSIAQEINLREFVDGSTSIQTAIDLWGIILARMLDVQF